MRHTQKKNLKSSFPKGGYRSKLKLKLTKPEAEIPKKEDKSVDIPPNINRVLAAKKSLLKHLISQYHEYITVSINVKDGNWVLEVRGENPLINSYNDYEVIYIENSVMVRNPNTRF